MVEDLGQKSGGRTQVSTASSAFFFFPMCGFSSPLATADG